MPVWVEYDKEGNVLSAQSAELVVSVIDKNGKTIFEGGSIKDDTDELLRSVLSPEAEKIEYRLDPL